ncbi:hypothetical protein GCM10023196_067250 [Actinoallomurus vinaceus]|uniref:Uncharacterized protein n=1 Tax=Actinoallomurus vinaceus TaxID=1080074 RepID=A0ABP8UKC3_9ACTN
MGEHEARSLITTLAAEPQPPSTIDVERAVRDGHRRRRRRLLMECGAVVAAVALVAGGVGLLGRSGGRSAPAPVAAPAPTRFDPLVRYADFGWLPPGMSERSVSVSSDGIVLEARTPKGKPYEWFESQVGVALSPAGRNVDDESLVPISQGSDENCPHDEQAGAASAIQGRPAQWVFRSDVAGTHCRWTATELRWQYAPGAWAAARIARAPGVTDIPATLVHIAETLQVDRKEPVRMPFQARYVPAGLRLAESLSDQGVPGSKKWRVELYFEPSGRKPSSGVGSQDDDSGPGVSIDVLPMSASDPNDETGPPNTTVDGHPAVRMRTKNGSGTDEVLRVLDVRGFEVSIMTSRLRKGEPERILRGLTLLGPDRTAWTTRPLG